MTKTYDPDGVRPDFQYMMLIGAIVPDGRVTALGYNADIDTASAPEDIWSGSSLGVLNSIDHKLLQFPASAVEMEIVSSSESDASAGSGVRTVLVTYLDTDYTSKTAVITMNGTTPVAMPENVRRINGMIALTVGTNPRGANVGNISIRATGGVGATYAYMLAGFGISQSSLFTVPAGRALDILGILFSAHQVDTNQRAATWTLCVQTNTGRLIKGLIFGTTSNSNYIHHMNGYPIISLAEKTDVWISCENVSANNTQATGALIGALR